MIVSDGTVARRCWHVPPGFLAHVGKPCSLGWFPSEAPGRSGESGSHLLGGKALPGWGVFILLFCLFITQVLTTCPMWDRAGAGRWAHTVNKSGWPWWSLGRRHIQGAGDATVGTQAWIDWPCPAPGSAGLNRLFWVVSMILPALGEGVCFWKCSS